MPDNHCLLCRSILDDYDIDDICAKCRKEEPDEENVGDDEISV